jgi:hypothetical protein
VAQVEERIMDCAMMVGHGPMMWGMALGGVLVSAVLLLSAAALAKYLFFQSRRAPDAAPSMAVGSP